MLMARRLVEAGVPFVSVFWYEDQKIADKCKSAGGWDTHASSGVRGRQVYGTSDRVAAYPDKNLVAPEDIAKTVYHSLGIDDIRPVGKEDQPLPILEEGNAIAALF